MYMYVNYITYLCDVIFPAVRLQAKVEIDHFERIDVSRLVPDHPRTIRVYIQKSV